MADRVGTFGESAESLPELSRALHRPVDGEVYSPPSPHPPYLGDAKSRKLEPSPGKVCVSRAGDEIAIGASPQELAILACKIEQRNNSGITRFRKSDHHDQHLRIEYYPGPFPLFI